jgi:hypothetical protein
MRHLISTALVALIIGALAGATMSGVAQEPSNTDPPDDRAFEVAGINADRVDGKHAIGSTYDSNLRKNKLVATNKQGLLPSNIVKPKWGLIRNKPGILADGQVGWGEVNNKPGGFADGVDNAGVTGIKLTYVEVKRTLAPGKDFADIAKCPTGAKVTGGGFYSGGVFGFEAIRSHPLSDLSGWASGGRNPTSSDMPVSTTAVCMQITPSGALTTATKK